MIQLKSLFIFIVFFFLFVLKSNAQNDTTYYPGEYDITKEEWQKQMDELAGRKQKAADEYYRIEKEKERLNKEKNRIDSTFNQLQLEIYNLIDANQNDIAEFNDRFSTTEKKILNESAPLKEIKEYWFDWITKSKIRLLEQYRTRYKIMKEKIDNWREG